MLKINGIIENQFTSPEELKSCIGCTVKLQGAIYKIRVMSGFAFVILRTNRRMIQCVYSEEFSDFPLELLKEEACVIIAGDVVSEERSKTGFELRLRQVQILTTPVEEMPVVINNKAIEASLDTLLDFRPITLLHENVLPECN